MPFDRGARDRTSFSCSGAPISWRAKRHRFRPGELITGSLLTKVSSLLQGRQETATPEPPPTPFAAGPGPSSHLRSRRHVEATQVGEIRETFEIRRGTMRSTQVDRVNAKRILAGSLAQVADALVTSPWSDYFYRSGEDPFG